MAEETENKVPPCVQEEPPDQCHPCKLMNKSVCASKYCHECEELLCEACVTDHTKRKATSSHKPTPIGEEKILILCSPCTDDENTEQAINYCEECEEYLCNDCTLFHGKRKATITHKPITIKERNDKLFNIDEAVPSCDPCKDDSKEIRSLKYCKECDECLCKICTNKHMNRKATRTHHLVPVSVLQRGGKKNGFQNRKICDPCLLQDIKKDAIYFCDECEELLCDECTNRHRSKKITRSHTLESPDCVEYAITVCEECEMEDKEAAMHCKSCDEALCDDCGKRHKKRSATKTHSIVSIPGRKLERIVKCDSCSDGIIKAEKYCTKCAENYCGGCVRVHSIQKKTKDHTLVNPVSDRKTKEARMKEVDICKGCSESKILMKYCTVCGYCLCEQCCEIHGRSKFTSSHVLHVPGEIENIKIQDCDSCKQSGSAKYYCEQCGEFFCTICNNLHQNFEGTRDHQVVSAQNGQLKSKAPKQGIGEIMQIQLDEGKSDKRKEHDNESTKKNCPGKPRSSDARADTIMLSWDPPSTFGDEDYYQISYKDLDNNKKWKFYQDEFKSSSAILSDLKSNTAFIFRVRVVYEDSEGPYSEESDKIITSDSPATRIVSFSVLKENGNPSPSIYALPITEIRQARNEKAKTKKFDIGGSPIQSKESKTIMLVGATGTGKSTLVDGIVNFVLGVKWDDPFRFTVIDLEQEEKDREKNQALSQTEWITCYTLNPEKGSRLKYPLNIIDTPGFGDTRGLKRDQEIVEQIRELFSEKEPKGVTFIDAVCFLIKAPDARLTAVQSYIFQSIMSLFGKDIEKNICSLVTFADGIDPPVLSALKASGLPFGKSFTFNNSGLFARNLGMSTHSLSPMFWDMGLKSFRAFFDYLEQMETRSLQLTKHVLDERFCLEATVRNLQPKLDAGLSKVNGMKQEIVIIEKNKSLIKDNKNFEYEVEETQQKRKELPRGQHVTNCTNCHFTCHESCAYANDDEKANCCAMDSDGNCKVCPDKCYWQKHANTPYIFEYIPVKVKKTYADMQKKYQEAEGKLLSQEQIVEKLGEELTELLDYIEDMMVTIKTCNERLEEIALRPNPLTMTEHIELMIENEKFERKEGFMKRIDILNDFKKKAEISKMAESFSEQARTTLGAVGKKRDPKTLFSRFKAWFN